jgi:ribosome-associated protein
MIDVSPDLRIPEREVEYTFSSSSKPGGQNVNKVSTRVTLIFDVASSPSLSDDQRRLITKRLGTRITKDGLLRVVSQKYRTQHANREAALVRFAEMLRGALMESRTRRRTSIPRDATERRLKSKKRRSLLKTSRSWIPDVDQ